MIKHGEVHYAEIGSTKWLKVTTRDANIIISEEDSGTHIIVRDHLDHVIETTYVARETEDLQP